MNTKAQKISTSRSTRKNAWWCIKTKNMRYQQKEGKWGPKDRIPYRLRHWSSTILKIALAQLRANQRSGRRFIRTWMILWLSARSRGGTNARLHKRLIKNQEFRLLAKMKQNMTLNSWTSTSTSATLSCVSHLFRVTIAGSGCVVDQCIKKRHTSFWTNIITTLIWRSFIFFIHKSWWIQRRKANS